VDLDASDAAERLLAGPRGRALCAAVAGLDSFRLTSALDRPVAGSTFARYESANAGRPGWRPPAWRALRRRARDAEADPVPSASELVARAVAAVDLAALAAVRDELALIPSLVDAIDDVMFSGGEELTRHALAPAVDALAPVAEALARAPGAAWWWDGCDLGAQRWIRFERGPERPPAGAGRALADWARSEDEREAARPLADVPFPPRGDRHLYSGTWWSTPPFRSIVQTSRALPGLPAVTLALMEDGPPDDAVEVFEVDVAAGAEILEVDGPRAWCELTERFPREVTLTRRHDWWRWTGWEGRWFIPDWQRVAGAFDGVHLSTAAYLGSSYRALPVSGGATCLSGFDPDETLWLTDVVADARSAGPWEGDVGPNRFHDRRRPWVHGGP